MMAKLHNAAMVFEEMLALCIMEVVTVVMIEDDT